MLYACVPLINLYPLSSDIENIYLYPCINAWIHYGLWDTHTSSTRQPSDLSSFWSNVENITMNMSMRRHAIYNTQLKYHSQGG